MGRPITLSSVTLNGLTKLYKRIEAGLRPALLALVVFGQRSEESNVIRLISNKKKYSSRH
jgi:hypothetical protein